jgi:TRAP-type C4-dicarboxylate transport system permease large subunit
MTTEVGYLITFLYILMVMFVSMVLESDSDSYDKESRNQKSMISACWILFAPIAIIYLIIMIIKNKSKFEN